MATGPQNPIARLTSDILTTSQAEEDVFRTYDLGVNSFITKPTSFDELLAVMALLGQYWSSTNAQSAA